MFVIATDCVGGHYYTKLNAEHNHPFFWCVIPPNTMLKFVTDFKNIDFADIMIDKSEKWNVWGSARNTFDIIIEDKYRVHYIHNKLSLSDDVPRKVGGDIYYKYAYKLTVENYEKRLKRMCELKEEPQFIVSEHLGYGYDEKMMTILSEKTNYKLAILTNKKIVTKNPLVTIIPISDYHITHYSNGRTEYMTNEAKSKLDVWKN